MRQVFLWFDARGQLPRRLPYHVYCLDPYAAHNECAAGHLFSADGHTWNAGRVRSHCASEMETPILLVDPVQSGRAVAQSDSTTAPHTAGHDEPWSGLVGTSRTARRLGFSTRARLTRSGIRTP